MIRNLDTALIRTFVTAADRASMTAAANALNLTQGAVSQQIKRTEKQLGQALFERTPGGLVPTEFGAVFTARLGAGFRELAQAVAMADEASQC
ncbi:MAG: LysR family transcriptional regulator, partial [Mesorhizobium sp.]